MVKKVRYNGEAESYYPCAKPGNVLVKGQEYEVIAVTDLGCQTNYTLKGIEGFFNSTWFDVVSYDDSLYMAVSYFMPVIGERFKCFKAVLLDGAFKFIEWDTSAVKEIIPMGNNIFSVKTLYSTYIVQVAE